MSDARPAPRAHRVWLCRILGHKFFLSPMSAAHWYSSDFCTRCGMRPWSPRART